MKPLTTVVEEHIQHVITLPPELGLKPGDKFSIEELPEGGIKLVPYEEITLELSDETFMQLALEAHKRNITLEDCVNQILAEKLDEHEAKFGPLIVTPASE